MNILPMTRMNYRPLALTATAALALSSPMLIHAAPPAIAAEQASDISCDADSLHAFSHGHQDLALVGDSGDLSFIARDDESGKDYASGEFYVEATPLSMNQRAAIFHRVVGKSPKHKIRISPGWGSTPATSMRPRQPTPPYP